MGNTNHEGAFKKLIGIYTDKSINPWVRGLTWAGTLVLLYIAGRAIYIKVFPSQSELDAKAEQKQVDTELQSKIEQGLKQGYDDSQYIDWANQIATSLAGCLSSVNAYSTIRDIFSKLTNDIDFLKLKKAYGTRTISRGFVCGGDIQNATMAQAIRVEFDSWQINGTWGGVALIGLNPTLEANGITYRI